MSEVRIGISGWRYPPWRGVFYPSGLAQKRELEFASRKVNSIEINGSFYSLQRPTSYQSWYEEVPEDFCFSVKGPRYITHIKRLKDPEAPLGNFFASGVLHLKHKLGPFLWQLPPSFLYDEEKLESFFSLLPRTIKEAVRLSQKADRREASYPEDLKASKQKLRHALEVRNHSFENPFFIELLRKYNVALVFADTAGKWPYIEDLTSDFVYVRLHGEKEIYSSGYDKPSLKWWASRIRLWQAGRQPKNNLSLSEVEPRRQDRDIYIYFDNDVKVRAPFDAINLSSMLD